MSVQTAARSEILTVIGDRMRVLVDGQHSGGAFEMFLVDAAEGSGPPPHAHQWLESYYVIDGKLLVEIERPADDCRTRHVRRRQSRSGAPLRGHDAYRELHRRHRRQGCVELLPGLVGERSGRPDPREPAADHRGGQAQWPDLPAFLSILLFDPCESQKACNQRRNQWLRVCSSSSAASAKPNTGP